MRAVGIKVLKNRLSEYVRLASNGETVLVTDRDKVVAELSPPQTRPPSATPNAKWEDMIRRGLVTPAVNPKAPLPERKPVMRLEELMKQLAQDRADRF